MWRTKFSRLTLGRSYLVNGPGRTGGLMFSAASRPMDLAQLELFAPFASFRCVMAQLDHYQNVNRYLASHRLTLKYRRWQLALTETLLYGGPNRVASWTYLNPLLFYHGEQINGPDLSGNTLGSLELSWLGNGRQVYAEVLIDDIQLDRKEPGDLEPNEIGVIAGFDLADPFGRKGLFLGLEYIALTNRTYKTPNSWEFFIHRGVPLGYFLGSDLERLNLLIKQYGKNWQLILQGDYLRRGEGDLDKLWDAPWMQYTVAQGYHEPFPTGVVEKTFTVSIEGRYLPRYSRYGFGRLEYCAIRNVDHSARNAQEWRLVAGIHCEFNYSFAAESPGR